MKYLSKFLAVLLIAGCTTMVFAAPAAAKKATLSFWTFQEVHTSFMKDAVESWNKANPKEQIELKIDVLPFDDLHNKLLLSIQAGTGAPDIADIEIGKFANFLKAKTPGLAPLNKYLAKDLDKLIIGRMNSYKKGDNFYGIDYHVGAAVMYYNTDLMKAAGVDIDKIVTWDDYAAAGKTVLAKTGKPMCTVESTEHWSYYPLIVQQGSDFLDKAGNGQLDNAINVKTLEFLKKLVDDGVAVVAPGGFHHSEEYWSFMNNSGAASVWMPLWYMGRFTAYMPKLSGKIAVRPLPVWTKGGARSAGMGGTGTAVMTQSKHLDLACRFLTYAKASKEGSVKTWTILGFDPIRWDAWTDPAMKAKNQYTDYFGTGVFDMLVSIKDEIKGINVSAKFPQAVTLVQKNVMFKVLGEKSATPQQALSDANKILNAK